MEAKQSDSGLDYSVMMFGVCIGVMVISFIDVTPILIRVFIFLASVLWFCFSPLSRYSWCVSFPYKIWLVVTLVTGLCLFFMNLFFKQSQITTVLTLGG